MSFKNLLMGACFASVLAMSFAHNAIAQGASIAVKATTDFYSSSSQTQAWSDETLYADLMSEIEGLAAHGLNPEHYNLAMLKRLKSDPVARDRVATSAWLLAAAHMTYGKLDPVSVEPNWNVAGRKVDLVNTLRDRLKNKTVKGSLDTLAPKQSGYGVLKAEYNRLQALANQTFTKIAEGETLKAGMSNPRIGTLQTRLAELGFLPQGTATNSMDVETVAAIKAFQLSADLDDDGAVGPATLKVFNRGSEERLTALRVNLERWRWLPDELGRRHLRANIAGFDVTAWNEGRVERTHLTIVGKTFRKTPVFSDLIGYMVFNPWWETPYSLAMRDKLPLFKRDPGAVQRLGFQVLDKSGSVVNASAIDWNTVNASGFPYRIRQAPGETNALGKVKIMFPNVHNIYLHDTPTRGLFAQRQRAFSSGCLRTQDPIDLSAWLLSETPEWTRARIDSAVESGKETRANLAKKIPVHILYFTVTAEAGGFVRFLDDIYDRDGAVLSGLMRSPL